MLNVNITLSSQRKADGAFYFVFSKMVAGGGIRVGSSSSVSTSASNRRYTAVSFGERKPAEFLVLSLAMALCKTDLIPEFIVSKSSQEGGSKGA